MTAAVDAITRARAGRLVECSALDWPTVREALQDLAGECIDANDTVTAMIALNEVKRLDSLFGVA